MTRHALTLILCALLALFPGALRAEEVLTKIEPLTIATDDDATMFTVEIADTDELPARARNTLVSFMRDIARWRDLAKTTSPAELMTFFKQEAGVQVLQRKDLALRSHLVKAGSKRARRGAAAMALGTPAAG